MLLNGIVESVRHQPHGYSVFSRWSGMTKSDPSLPFKVAGANVGYRIAKRSFDCRDQLGS
jgi:hypothetical protein